MRALLRRVGDVHIDVGIAVLAWATVLSWLALGALVVVAVVR